MQATPTTWRMLVESDWEGKSDLRIFCGGEALTSTSLANYSPVARTLEHVWTTETTIWSSTERLTSADQISLGRRLRTPNSMFSMKVASPFPKASPANCGLAAQASLAVISIVPS